MLGDATQYKKGALAPGEKAWILPWSQGTLDTSVHITDDEIAVDHPSSSAKPRLAVSEELMEKIVPKGRTELDLSSLCSRYAHQETHVPYMQTF